MPNGEAAEDRQLVAYPVLAPDLASDPEAGVRQVREWLRRRLPAYLVPDQWVPVDALPLTPNGKVDRRRLPRPVAGAPATVTATSAAATPGEALAAGIPAATGAAAALAAGTPQAPRPQAPTADRAEERAIASIWAEVLGLEHVGDRADFFDLGGHSLLPSRSRRACATCSASRSP